MKQQPLANCSTAGFSIIEVLVAISLLGILTLVMVELFAHQNKEVRSISDRLAAQDIKRELLAAIDTPSFCSCLLRRRRFNSSRPNSSRNLDPTIRDIPEGYRDPIPAWPNSCRSYSERLIPRSGRKITGTNLVVDSIRLTDVIQRSGPVYAGNLTVAFRKQRNNRIVKPVSVPMVLTIDTSRGSRSSRPIVNCGIDVPTPTDDSYLAFYNGARVFSGRVANTGNIRCRRSMVTIRYGARYITDNGRDGQGILTLRVNGTDRNTRQGGGRVSGGDLTNPPTTLQGTYVMPCTGSVRANTRWQTINRSPSVQWGFIELQFFDP